MYNRNFWLAYAANTMLMMCVSVLFRYGNFVTLRGGSEFTLGMIVGVGMVGALTMRGLLGLATDRYGARLVWMGSLVLIFFSLLGHYAITPHFGQPFDTLVYLARILQMVGLAGAFGASLTFISLRAPEHRIGEMVGMLGTSGFIGLAIGPMLSDRLFVNGEPITAAIVQRMFLVAACAALVSLALTALATRGSKPIKQKPRPSALWLLRRYHPGIILLCSAAMGIGVMLPHTFLQPYTEHLNIHGIRTFFLAYAATAFSVRILTRRFTDQQGVRRTMQVGFTFLALSMLSFTLVGSEMMLALPAVLGGVSHAFLFPAVIKGGSISFPARYRGLATTLVLSMFDLSNLVGQPAIGAVVRFAPRLGLPGYGTLFIGMASLMTLAGIAAFWVKDDASDLHDKKIATHKSEPSADERELVEVGS